MKRKFEPTRRKKAVRTCGVLLVMLVLLNMTRGWFCLTPGMARWRREADVGIGGTRQVWQGWDNWQWGLFFTMPCQLTLTENSGVTALHYNYPTVLGWSHGCHVLDCTTPGPVWHREFPQYDDGRLRVVAFGRIDDPAAERLELKLDLHGYDEDPGTRPQVFSMDSSEWQEADGRRYYILRQEYTAPEYDSTGWNGYIWTQWDVTVYDADGAVIYPQV